MSLSVGPSRHLGSSAHQHAKPSSQQPMRGDETKSGMRFDGYSALVIVSGLTVTVAPSLGGAGTYARMMCALWAAAALVHIRLSREPRLQRSRVIDQMTMLGFFAALAMAATTPVGLAYGVSRLTNWLMFVPLGIVFFRRPRYGALAVVALLVGAVQTVGVLLQVKGVLGGVWGGALISGNDYNPITSRWLVRYTGFVQDPNNLAILMNLCAIACLSVAWMRRDRRARMLMIGGVAASAGVVVVTGSRGGLIGIPLGLLVFSLFTGTRALIRIAIFAAIGSWAALNAHFSSLDGLLSTFTKVVGGQDPSIQQRLAVWTKYQEGGLSPIFGQGFGGYNQTALRGSGFDVSADAARQATVDNSWLKLLLETGVIGVTFAALVVLCCGTALIRAVKTGAPRPVVAGVGAAIAIVVWRSASTDALDINPYNMIVPLLIAAALQLAQPIDRRSRHLVNTKRNHAKDQRQPSAGTAMGLETPQSRLGRGGSLSPPRSRAHPARAVARRSGPVSRAAAPRWQPAQAS
jgi:hypothetical protein